MEHLHHLVLEKALAAALLLWSLGVDAGDVERQVFKNCPRELASAGQFERLTLLNSRINLLQGWSHAADSPEQFILQQPSTAYAIDNSRFLPQGDCRGDKTYQTILVKKIGDWSQNHVNGIEPIIEQENIPFAKVAAIQLTLRVNSADTAPPTVESIQKAFAFAAEPAALAALDQGHATLGLTLFGEHFTDQSISTPNARYLFSIEPARFNDWLTVTLPVEQLDFYWEQNYAPLQANFNELASEKIIGLRVTPETDSGRVARHLNPDAWQSQRQELFKEMAVEFREIALLMHPK